MNLLDAGNLIFDRPSGQFVNQLPEGGVFLRRTSYCGKGPDCISLGVHLAHPQIGKRVSQAVITQMIAKRTLRSRFPRIDIAGNDEIRIMANAIAVHIAVAEAAAGQQPGKGHLA
ncbi:hypothetical protein D3C71_1952630 [compost metagenome]